MKKPEKTAVSKRVRRAFIVDIGGLMLSTDSSVIDRAEHLQPLVKERGRPGSRVVRAFALFQAHVELDWSHSAGFQTAKRLARAAMKEWAAVGRGEQKRILKGWVPIARYPSVPALAKAHQAWQNHGGESVGRFVELTIDTGGRSMVRAEFDFTHGWTAPVQMKILEGTDKATAIAAVRSALAVLESSWDRAIELQPKKFFSVEPARPVLALAHVECDVAISAA